MKGKVSAEDNSDNSQEYHDLSILRKPITTSITGFNEAIKAFESGTDEIRQLLSQECDIIYECKVCRNIFRSLANFISHKRVYCRTRFNSTHHFHFRSNGFIDQDISTIMQAEKDNTNNNSKDKTTENTNKDLSSIIERLLAKKNVNKVMKLTDFYDQVNHKLTQEEILRKKHILQLDTVPNSNVAVYQTIKTDKHRNGGDDVDDNEIGVNCDDNIKTEVTEVHNLLLNNKTVLGPDGKIITMDEHNLVAELPVIFNSDDFENNTLPLLNSFTCDICHLKFATEKTLKLHIELKHIPTAYVYQCPSCSQTFMQPAAVIRHLSNDHKKSMKRVRLLRESILKRRIRVDEIQVKGPSRELIRLQTDKERLDDEKKAWFDHHMENIEKHNSYQSMCTFCGKTFERKAVLTTHLNNCPQKNTKYVATTTTTTTTSTVTTTTTTTSSATKKNIKKDIKSTSEIVISDENSNSFDTFLSNQMNKEIIQSNLHNKLNTNIDAVGIDSENSNEKSDVVVMKSLKEIPIVDEMLLVNKRKRKRVTKVANDESVKAKDTSTPNAQNVDELYWSMDESGDLKVKKSVLAPTPSPSLSQSVIDQSLESNSITLTEIDTNIECEICNKKFATQHNLKRHTAMFHYLKKRFLCKLCQFGGFRKTDVIAHLGTSHNIMGDKNVVKEFIILAKEEKKEVVISENDDSVETTVGIQENSSSQPPSSCTSPHTIDNDDSASNSSVIIDNAVQPKKRGRPKGSSKKQLPAVPRSPTLSRNVTKICKIEKKYSYTKKLEKFSDKTNEEKIVKEPEKVIEKSKETVEILSSKRPIRNRIKPVNKDFVYDLSNLLKKEVDPYKDLPFMPVVQVKKKKSVSPSATETSPPISPTVPLPPLPPPPPPPPPLPPLPPQLPPQLPAPLPIKEEKRPIIINNRYKITEIKGAALAMAQAEVALHLACFYKPPIIPADRPDIPAKILQFRRSDGDTANDWSIVKKKDTLLGSKTICIKKVARHHARRVSDDVIVKGLAKKKRQRKKSSPILILDSPENSFNNDIIELSINSSNITNNLSSNATASEDEVMVKCPTEQEFKQYLVANKLADPVKKIIVPTMEEDVPLITAPVSSTKTNGKRITLMERLAENKSKKKHENIFQNRYQLENEDDDGGDVDECSEEQ